MIIVPKNTPSVKRSKLSKEELKHFRMLETESRQKQMETWQQRNRMRNDDNYLRIELRKIFQHAPACRIKSHRSEVFIQKWDREMQVERELTEKANAITVEQIKGRKWK